MLPLLLPRFSLGSNYQLDELRRVLPRIDIVSNAQSAADIKIRWVRISSELVDRRGLLTRIDIQESRRTPRKIHSRCRLGSLSTIHESYITKSPHSKPNMSLLITLSSSGHRLSFSSSGQWFYLADSPTYRGIISKRLVVVTELEGSASLSHVTKYRGSIESSEFRTSQRPASRNGEMKVRNSYIRSPSVP